MVLEEKDISASQIKKWKGCPLAWWYRYVSDYPSTKRRGEYMDVGSAVHEAVEELLNSDVEITLEKDEERLTRELNDAMLSVYWAYDWENTDVPERMMEDGEEYVEKIAGWLAENADMNIVGVEDEVRFKVNDGTIDDNFTAIMDVVTDRGVIDWKTGRVKEEAEVIQGSVYMAAYGYEYGEYPEYVKFVYVKEDKVRTVSPDDDDENWEYMMKHAKALSQGKREEVFPAKPGGNCYWCGWEAWCSEAPNGYGSLDYDDI